MSIELTVNTRALDLAMAAGPKTLEKHISRAIGRTLLEMARSAKHYAPKAFSTLVNSIDSIQASPLEGLVITGVDYARAVEEGTKGGGIPPERAIIDWIRVRRIRPRNPKMSQEQLAYVIARSIAQKGTPAHPFMRPAFEENKASAEIRIKAAIGTALAEITS